MTLRRALLRGFLRGVAIAAVVLAVPVGWRLGQEIATFLPGGVEYQLNLR